MRPLIAGRPAVNVVRLDVVDSTNAWAERLMAAWSDVEEEARLPETLLLAGRQSAGRGRGGNAWTSPPGGLYATWLTWHRVEQLSLLPLAVGACLAITVEDLLPGVAVGLKWPNDLVVGGKKLGGVLCQSRVVGGEAWVAVGFGVNVETSPVLAAEAPGSASLCSLGWGGEIEEAAWRIAAGFLARIHATLQEGEATRDAWAARSTHVAGEVLRVRLVAGEVVGAFRGFDREGHLLLEVDGVVRTVSAGEVVQGTGEAV